MEMDLLMFVLFSLIGGASFAVMFRIPKRHFLYAVGLAVLARTCLTFFATDNQVGIVTFITAFIIGFISHILARWTGAPSQIFLIPGVITLVPGTFIYRAFNSALNNRMLETLQHGVTVITISAGISFALLLANWIMPSRKLL